VFRLYRAVSSDELADIAAQDGFRPGPNTLEGKWFAESAEAAQRWGQLLYTMQKSGFHLIQVDIPQDVAARMFRLDLLDQIGPARYAENEVLGLINQQHQGISEVPMTLGGGP